MVISPVEDCPNTPHRGEKLRDRFSLTMAVVQFCQRHAVLIRVVKPAAVEIILHVALNCKNHSRTFRSLLFLSRDTVRAAVRLQIVLLAQILRDAQCPVNCLLGPEILSA